MFRLYCKTLQFSFQSSQKVGLSETHFHFPKIFPSLFLKSFSSKTSLAPQEDNQRQEDGFSVVQYLRNSWFLSPEIALSMSKKVKLKTPEKADRVLGLLRDYGFTDTHISRALKSCPKLLSADAHQTFLPKFEFFCSLGVSGDDLVETLSRGSAVLFLSLENNIIPFYNVIKREFGLGSILAKIFGYRPWRFSSKKMLSELPPDISVLRGLGVRDACIVSLLTGPRAFVLFKETEKFKENVEKVISMGFDPSMSNFTSGLAVISSMSKSRWDEKMELYSKCGWSGDEILSAFRRSPVIMSLSKKNILSKMDLLVNGMGWKPADIARASNVLHYGLEKWMIPRSSVIKVLLSKDLIDNKPSLSMAYVSSKETFLKKFNSFMMLKHWFLVDLKNF